MTARFGIDTSILVRLATGDPEDGFQHCVRKLTTLSEREDAEAGQILEVIGDERKPEGIDVREERLVRIVE